MTQESKVREVLGSLLRFIIIIITITIIIIII